MNDKKANEIKEIVIELDFLPISVNMSYCISKTGRMYRSKKHQQCKKLWGAGLKPYIEHKMSGPVEIEYQSFYKKEKK